MENNLRHIKNITVIGGGTAGWLAALYAKTTMPSKSVTVVESQEIGILGAGEGSTAHLVSFFDILGIPVSDLVTHTGATIKASIKFTNWNNRGKTDYYHHPFSMYNNVNPDYHSFNHNFVQSTPSLFAAIASSDDGDYRHFSLHDKLSKDNKVPFLLDENRQNVSNPISQYEGIAGYSIHFDAVKLAAYLKEVALSRGIKWVEGIVEDYTEKDNGDIDTLILKSGEVIECSFIIDCSGFKSFFPKKFKSKWVSYKDTLPVDSAIPFFLPIEEDSIPPYTEAIAMKYGWMWKIPLQERYGCGYVFDSTLINSDEAKKEVEEYLGHSIEVPRTLTFEPGYYKTPWVKNVISIGLSAGFVEPLEATSIWTSISTLGRIFSTPDAIYRIDQRFVDEFNEDFCRFNESVFAFIYFHYMTERDDTEFWKKFTRDKAPEILKKVYNISDYRLIQPADFGGSFLWPIDSFFYVGLGTNQLNLKKFSKLSMFYNFTANFTKSNLVMYKKTIDEIVTKYCSTHKDFLDRLKNKDNQ
jgi:tryptophan 7-halogenase